VFTGGARAELIKYAANAFLATKITFINEIADLCEKPSAPTCRTWPAASASTTASATKVPARRPRLWRLVLPEGHAGPGRTAQDFDGAARAQIVETVVKVNDAGRKRRWPTSHRPAAAASLRGKTVAVLGLTFKPNTDDMRDAPSIGRPPV
jgi:UDPglucose 6-dehydrogenase